MVDVKPGGSSPFAPFGDDERGRMLLTLVSKNVITYADAESIAKLTTADTSRGKVMGLVAGEIGVNPLRIEAALSGTPYAISAREVEEQKRSFVQSLEAGLEFFNSRSEAIFDWGAAPIRWGGETVNYFIDMGWGEEGYYSEISEADRADRARVASNVRAEIDLMVLRGAITEGEGTNLKAKASRYNDDDYRDIFNAITEAHASVHPDSEHEVIRRAMVVQDVRRRGHLIDTPDTEMPDGTWLSPTTGVLSDEAIARAEVGLDYVQEGRQPLQGSFSQAGIAAGLGADAADIAQALNEMRRPMSISPILAELGFSNIYDPSSGRTFSPEEWQAIMQPLTEVDHALRSTYLATKRTSESVGALLDKFNALPLPIEDLSIRSPVPTQPWETNAIAYREGDGAAQWASMSPRSRMMRSKAMYDYGFINEAQYEMMANGGGPYNMLAIGIWEQATRVANQFQTDPLSALGELAKYNSALQAANTISRGGGASAPKYSVPASLREIPDYDALAAESKSLFQGALGRELEDWEVSLLADKLKIHYEDRNRQRIDIHREAWEDAVAGGTVDVDFSEVADPASSLSSDIEDLYANERDRLDRVDDNRVSRNVLMQSITTGRRMV